MKEGALIATRVAGTSMPKAAGIEGMRIASVHVETVAPNPGAGAITGRPSKQDRRNQLSRRQVDLAWRQLARCEREQLAHHLHADLGGLLTALKGTLEIVISRAAPDPQSSAPLMANALALATTAFLSVRRMGVSLHPTLLVQLGFWEAISWLVEGVIQRTAMVVSLHCDATLLQPCWPDEVERIIFQMISETITNVEKHARAHHIAVKLFSDESEMTICVEDDGIGADQDALRGAGSLGVDGLRKQARALGGRLVFGASPRGGLRVVMRLPLWICNAR